MPKHLTEDALLTYAPSSAVADDANLRILVELQQNRRLSMMELGRRVGMSSPAVTERVRRLEESGVIRGYRLDIDPTALGLAMSAHIRVRPNAGQLPRVAELARTIPEISDCDRVTGEDCFAMKIHLPDLSQLDRILDAFLAYGTTTSLIQSSPVTRRDLPLRQAT